MGYQWTIAQEGSRQTYAVPVAFEKINCLRQLCTDVWCRRGRKWLLKGTKAARVWAGRYHGNIPDERVVSFDRQALLYLGIHHFRRASMGAEAMGAYYLRFGRWFDTNVARHLSRMEFDPEKDCFFGFNTTSLETLRLMKSRQVFTVLDQIDPGLVEEEMVREEAELWPGWEKLPGRMPPHYWERLRTEWEVADAVLVNSEWSRDALIKQGVPAKKLIVIPLAVDLDHSKVIPPIDPRGPLKVVWMGSVILRKGIQYLVEAAKMLTLENIEFILAGPIGISEQVVNGFPNNVKVLGRVTRDQLKQIYQQGHLFVLPTISDGFAVTQLEAMAQGLPVVTTPNCGRVVTDGVDGLIVPPRDAAALAAAIARLNRDRELLREMSRQALETIKRYDLPSNAYMIDEEVSRLRGKSVPESRQTDRQASIPMGSLS